MLETRVGPGVRDDEESEMQSAAWRTRIRHSASATSASGPPAPAEPKLPEPVSQDRAECEKMTRDAIDAIDLEMRENPYTKEHGEEYRAELLALTQQLRARKQL